MKFLSLQPFIPSGKDFESAKQLFKDLGFEISWDAGEYVGFERGNCKFILQKYDKKEFAENLMISVGVDDLTVFLQMVKEKDLVRKYKISVGEMTKQPYGKEVNVIDMAGVCWHFIQE